MFNINPEGVPAVMPGAAAKARKPEADEDTLGVLRACGSVANGGRSGTMKITVNIDCTPDEARTFFGLPDVKPMQEKLLREVEARLSANLQAMDPDTMLKTWLSAFKGFEGVQEKFLAQMAAAARAKSGRAP